MIRRAAQGELPFPRGRGGKRPGAGRRPKGERPGVSHRARPRFANATPAHVTLRVRRHVWNLRSQRSYQRILACFKDALGRFGLRLIQFSVQGNHLHLIVEAQSSESLSRGMQGLCIRLARALNALMGERGPVFADHFHSRLLESPAALVRAIAYVLGNHAHHVPEEGDTDRFSSALLPAAERGEVLAQPQCWLLRIGWRKAPPAALAQLQRFGLG